MPQPTLPQVPIGAAGTTVTLPTHAVGDLLICCGYNNIAATAISAAAAGGTVPTWVSIDNPAGANLNALGVFQAVATATNHTSGTWAGSTHMCAIVVRGQKAAGFIGAHGQGGSAAANSSVAPAITLTNLTGSSLVLAIHFHKGLTAIGAAPSGYTQQLASVAALCAVNTLNNTTASPGAVTQTDTSASGGYRGEQFEILPIPVSLPASPRTARNTLLRR